MKFTQLQIGQRFLYQGKTYRKATPLMADPENCEAGENPLECEFRIAEHRVAVRRRIGGGPGGSDAAAARPQRRASSSSRARFPAEASLRS